MGEAPIHAVTEARAVQAFHGQPGQPQWRPSPFPGKKPNLFTGRATARRARLSVPYLGPDPAPSRSIVRVLIGACAIGVLARLAQAFAYTQRAGLDRRLATGAITRSSLLSNTHLLTALGVGRTVSWIVVLVGLVLWGRARRPKPVLTVHGEAYVESPFPWIVTAPLLVVTLAVAVIGVVASIAGTPSPTDDLMLLATRRDWSAVSCTVWGASYLVAIAMVLRSERTLAERLAASSSHRAGADSFGEH